MKRVVIVGNSIAAEIMHAYLRQDSRYEVVAFTADAQYIKESTKDGRPVIPLDEIPAKYPAAEFGVLMAVGYGRLNTVRRDLFDRLKKKGYFVETYIHPDAKVYNGGAIGEGSLIMANTVLEVYSRVGANSVIWANCVVGHHAVVGENCWIASGTVLAGQVTVGDNCFFGVSATVSNQISVGAFNVIGSHTAIHKNTKENEVYISGHGVKHRFPAKDYASFSLK